MHHLLMYLNFWNNIPANGSDTIGINGTKTANIPNLIYRVYN